MAGKEKKSKNLSQDMPESIYINRELSWLEFNLRVLQEAADPAVPLLERLKFLMIYQSNLEEFYRVRIGIMTHRALLQPDKPDPLSGLLPEAQIKKIKQLKALRQGTDHQRVKKIKAHHLDPGHRKSSPDRVQTVKDP